MSQKINLLKLFELNGGKLTLGQIMKTPLAAEYRARISEMRREGFIINCTKMPEPSNNLYELVNTKPDIQAKIAEYRKIQAEYPAGHRQRDAIETQINKIILAGK